MGRPPIGATAMTMAERSRRYRARRKARGSLERRFDDSGAALHQLWLEILGAGSTVDSTVEPRNRVRAAQEILEDVRAELRELARSPDERVLAQVLDL